MDKCAFNTGNRIFEKEHGLQIMILDVNVYFTI